MTPLNLLMQNQGEAGALAVETVPEGPVVPKDLMATGMTKKMRKMKDQGNEDVNAEGGSQSAQREVTKAVALMDLEILLMAGHALPPGDGERPPPNETKFPRS